MKLIYSHLQKFLPALNVQPHHLRDDLTSIGHFTNYFEPVGSDFMFDLDIKVNRGDCLGYYGLAKDLSVLYHLPLHLPPFLTPNYPQAALPIEIKAPAKVKRVMAVKLSDLKNTPSPPWLKSFVEAHLINSVNTVVDLTNYIMFYWGIPNHAFDTAKSGDHLVWELNNRFESFITLDGSVLSLKPDILMVNSLHQPLSLSFLGGQSCAIDLSTREIIIEMAVYDRSQVKSDSRFLKTTTEAGVRLDKNLDPNLIPQAFNHLTSLLLELCGGQITSSLYDYYPSPVVSTPILFDSAKPSIYSGIHIPTTFALNCLSDLGCEIINNSVTPPTIRPDLNLEEDLIEEVMRFWGYDKIPTTEPIDSGILPSITPPIITLSNFLKVFLVGQGYDEVLSWPLVKIPTDPATAVSTQNSINSEYPYLRQNLQTSLLDQLDSYHRLKLPNPQFFEIGQVFSQINGNFQETTHLALYQPDKKNQLLTISEKLNKFLELASPLPFESNSNNVLEINLTTLLPLINLPKLNLSIPSVSLSQAVVELTSQIISLDANVTLSAPENPNTILEKYRLIVPNQYLWSMSLIDQFANPKTKEFRYTFRVFYYNCTDKVAKKIHLDSFGLN